jgi:ubiquinone/menaquinone biosynthesis C-methylase UbiE
LEDHPQSHARSFQHRLIRFYKQKFNSFLESKLKSELVNCNSFIELGCGVRSPAAKHVRNKRTIGIDRHVPSLRLNKKTGYFEDYILADLTYLPLKDNSFDCVAAFDVIEHLTKPQAKQLIEDMERISKKKVIISTPNGFNPKCHLEDDNPLQIHKCGWTVQEMSKSGYVVFGIDGLLGLRGESGSATIKPEVLGSLLSRLSDPFVYKCPTTAFQLLCIKPKS